MIVERLMQELDALMPFDAQEEWDESGLIVHGNRTVKKIGICLDIESIYDRIIQHDIDLVISHHPPYFREKIFPLSKKGLIEFVESGISVISCHTNADVARDSFVDLICKKLGIREKKPLRYSRLMDRLKVVVFVPQEQVENVLNAAISAGAGKIGFYEGCSFRSEGLGTYIPKEGAVPYLGTVGKLNTIDEVRLEFEAREETLEKCLEQIFDVHPYEEPIVEVYRFNRFMRGSGLGRIGQLVEPLSAEVLFLRAKTFFEGAKLLYDANKPIKTVAICPGSCSNLFNEVVAKQADAFLTSDIGYHSIQKAKKENLTIIDIPHYEAESFFIDWLAEKLESFGKTLNIEIVKLHISRKEIDYNGYA